MAGGEQEADFTIYLTEVESSTSVTSSNTSGTAVANSTHQSVFYFYKVSGKWVVLLLQGEWEVGRVVSTR